MSKEPFSTFAEVNPPRDGTQLLPGAPVSFIPMEDVSESGQWTTKRVRPLSEVRSGFTAFRENDVLFAKITPCMENGKGCIAENLVNGIGFGSTEFHVLRAINNHEPRFVFHWTQSDEMRLKAEAFMIGSAGQQRVQSLFFSKFSITPLTPDEQHRIALILDTADAAIAKTEALIAKLKQMKAGLLHDLLTRGIDENGELRHEAFTHPRARSLEELPLGYRAMAFGQLANFINGKGFNEHDWKEHGIPIIRIQNLNGEESFNYYGGPICSEWEVLPGDLLFAWSGTRETSFGPRIWSGPRGVLNQHIFKVVPDDSLVTTTFLDVLLRFYLELIAESAHGFKTSFVHVKRGDVTSVVVPVPPTDEQREIMSKLSAQDGRIQSEETALGKLRKLKAGLMNDLLTGKKPVFAEAAAAT